jgi:hypothetical protein
MWPSAAGLGSDDENALRVPGVLAQIVVTRQEWVDSVGEVFDAMERERGSGLGSSRATEPYGRGRHVHWQTTQCGRGKARGRGGDGC